MSKYLRLLEDIFLYSTESRVPLLYFDSIPNVGDLISGYLVRKLSGKDFYKPKTKIFPHLSAVGSTLSVVSSMSHIWGSGSIDGSISAKGVLKKKIHALRGLNTLRVVRDKTDFQLNCPLGDPALLMPDFYDCKIVSRYKVGIVPHFDEYELVSLYLKGFKDEFLVIDVRSDPETFIDQLRSCEIILSSSLHGLILSDAYMVPSVWFSASNKLIGGVWKFLDYYTCTDSKISAPFYVKDDLSLIDLVEKSKSISRVNGFKFSKNDLLNSYPDIF